MQNGYLASLTVFGAIATDSYGRHMWVTLVSKASCVEQQVSIRPSRDNRKNVIFREDMRKHIILILYTLTKIYQRGMCPFVCARACFLCLLSWSLLTNTFLGSWLPIASSIREDCRLGIHVSDSFARQAIVVSYFLHGHNVLYQKYLKICYLLIHCGIYCPKVWYIVYNIYLYIHTIQWIYCISCRYHDESVSVGQEILANGLKWVWLDAAWHLRIAAYRSACSCSSCNESTRSWRLDGDAAQACKDSSALKVQRSKAWNNLAASVLLQTRQAYSRFKAEKL